MAAKAPGSQSGAGAVSVLLLSVLGCCDIGSTCPDTGVLQTSLCGRRAMLLAHPASAECLVPLQPLSRPKLASSVTGF